MNYRAARLKKIAHRLHRQGKFAESKEAQQLFKKAIQGGGSDPGDRRAVKEGLEDQDELQQDVMEAQDLIQTNSDFALYLAGKSLEGLPREIAISIAEEAFDNLDKEQISAIYQDFLDERREIPHDDDAYMD
jgi:hypothetical protein